MFLLCSSFPSRRFTAALAIAAGISVAGAASSQTVLSYSPWAPAGYVVNEAVMPWMQQVEAVTEGRVKIVPRAAGVGAPKEQFDVVRDGVADISLVVPSFTPGRFPLMELGELSLLSSDAAILAPAFYRQYEKHLAEHKPFAGTHVLSVFNVAPAQLATRESVIDDLADLKGVKIRVANAPTGLGMKALGAVPVQTSISEIYSMASSGVVDGVTMPYEPTLTWNLHPFFKHITVVPGGLGQSGMAVLVNEKKWSSISQQDREAIMAISGEPLAAAVGRVVAKGERDSAAALRKAGVTIQPMPPAVLAKVVEAFKPVDEAWFAKARKAGLENPEQVLADFRAELKLAEKN